MNNHQKPIWVSNLRKARQLLNWKQEAAAKKIGIKQTYYSRLETGKIHNPSYRIFARICNTFKIVDPLRFIEDENYFTNEENKVICTGEIGHICTNNSFDKNVA